MGTTKETPSHNVQQSTNSTVVCGTAALNVSRTTVTLIPAYIQIALCMKCTNVPWRNQKAERPRSPCDRKVGMWVGQRRQNWPRIATISRRLRDRRPLATSRRLLRGPQIKIFAITTEWLKSMPYLHLGHIIQSFRRGIKVKSLFHSTWVVWNRKCPNCSWRSLIVVLTLSNNARHEEPGVPQNSSKL